MKKAILFCCSLSLALCSLAQTDDMHKASRTVGSFHGVSISNGIDLFYTQGAQSVSISATDAATVDLIVTEVENGILQIHLKKGDWNLHHVHMKAYVSSQELTKLEASGGSDVTLENAVKANKLSIELSGGSDLKGNLSAEDLSIRQSGGSDVSISGDVKRLDDEASGGSDLSGYDLITDVCHINASGGSDAHLTVNKELTATASGGSDVYYKGNAAVKSVSSSGSSTIVKKG